MTKEFGAYFFDSTLLGESSGNYLAQAQKMVDDLLQSEEYRARKMRIIDRQMPSHAPPHRSSSDTETPVNGQHKPNGTVQPQHALVLASNPRFEFDSSATLEGVSRYKQSRLAKSGGRAKRPKHHSKNLEYLRLSRKIFEKVNENAVQSLGKRAEMMQETVNEVNSKRFESQNKWLEEYLELREEIKDHRTRIISLRKALQK